MLLKLIIVIFLGIFEVIEALTNPQLWSVSGNDESIIANTLHRLEDEGMVDIWSTSPSKYQFLVESEAQDTINRTLSDANLPPDIIMKDLMDLIEKERDFMDLNKRRKKRQATVEQMDWNSYHELDAIDGYLNWVNRSYSDFVTIFPVATTQEGRPVNVVRVTDPDSRYKKKRIWIEGGIHAREWISHSATLFLLHQIATNPEWRPLIKRIEWFVVPVANPDGYFHTFTSKNARLWRKNRKLVSRHLSKCRGVDLNRNWDFHWGVGASTNPCSPTYRGSVPFSEPEANGLAKMMKKVGNIDLFITFHSFGQAVLYPWGWTKKKPRNVDDLEKMGQKFIDAVSYVSKTSTSYLLGGSGALFGLASGASDDWTYGALGTPYSYTIELRDHGTYGFLLPETQIKETVKETVAGVYCMASYLVNYGPCA